MSDLTGGSASAVGRRDVNKRSERRLATVAVGSTLLLASSFPYLFIGPLPGWIAAGLASMFLAIACGRFFSSNAALREVRWVIGSWFALVLAMLLMDVLAANDRNLMAGPVLSLLTLMTFMGTLAAASFANRRATVGIIFAIAFAQGCVSILQFFEVRWAWEIGPDIVTGVPFLSRIESADMLDYRDFSNIGRVRGTHVFVHIFNAVQSTLFAFCVFIAFHASARRSRRTFRLSLARCTVVLAGAGLILNFSRSGALVVVMTLIVTLAFQPTTKRTAHVIAVMVLLVVALLGMGFTDAPQRPRLFLLGMDDVNNAIRLEHVGFAWHNAVRSPLVGTSNLPGEEPGDLPIHSVPLRFLNDYGVIGLTLYASVGIPFVVLFARALRNRNEDIVALAGCGMCVLFAIAADSWTHSSGFLKRDIVHGVVLALVVGSIVGIRGRPPGSHVGRRHGSGNLLRMVRPDGSAF